MTSQTAPRPAASTVMIAIPVKNEVERLAACLTALAEQKARGPHRLPSYGVLLFVNNSDDGTAELARSLAAALPFPLTVMTAVLPSAEASAGAARRHAMEAAAGMLDPRASDGVLMTTDADSRVPPHWIADTLAALNAGVDAVAGTVAIEPGDEAAFPQALKARGALEAQYETLVCEIEARLSPDPSDPWPRHPTESGASFALTLASFRAVGGVPDKALGEDRALASALRQAGFRIRHEPGIVVLTSGRLVGRATGGCADTMRHRIEQPTASCDDYLRPVSRVLREAREPGLGSEGRRGVLPRDLPREILIARVVLLGLSLRDGLRDSGSTLRRWIASRVRQCRRVARGHPAGSGT